MQYPTAMLRSIKNLAIGTLVFTLSYAALTKAELANAATFSFKQGGFGFEPQDHGLLSGTFTGEDFNNDGSIDLATPRELQDFSVTGTFSTTFSGQVIGSTFTFTKNNLETFSFSPNNSSSLAFTAGDPGFFYKTVNACLLSNNSFLYGCGIPLVSVGQNLKPGIISLVLALTFRGGGCQCTIFSSQEAVEVVNSSTSIPESNSAGGILLLTLGALVVLREKHLTSQ